MFEKTAPGKVQQKQRWMVLFKIASLWKVNDQPQRVVMSEVTESEKLADGPSDFILLAFLQKGRSIIVVTSGCSAPLRVTLFTSTTAAIKVDHSRYVHSRRAFFAKSLQILCGHIFFLCNSYGMCADLGRSPAWTPCTGHFS